MGIIASKHRIVCKSNWEGCHGRHATVAEVRECFEAKRDGAWPCTWLIEGLIPTGDPDEPYYRGTFECGAPTQYTDDRGSYECTAGHDFIPPEVRQEQGWDYAADRDEAMGLAKAGVLPVQMDGKSFL